LQIIVTLQYLEVGSALFVGWKRQHDVHRTRSFGDDVFHSVSLSWRHKADRLLHHKGKLAEMFFSVTKGALIFSLPEHSGVSGACFRGRTILFSAAVVMSVQLKDGRGNW